jgi:hypothetical protein
VEGSWPRRLPARAFILAAELIRAPVADADIDADADADTGSRGSTFAGALASWLQRSRSDASETRM